MSMGLGAWKKRAKSLEVEVQKRAKIANQRVRRFTKSDKWTGELTPAMEGAIKTNEQYGLSFGHVGEMKKQYADNPKMLAESLHAELERINKYNQSVTGSVQGWSRYMTNLYRNVTRNPKATFKQAMEDRTRSTDIVNIAKELYEMQQDGGLQGIELLTLGSPPEGKSNFMYVVREVSKSKEWNKLERTEKFVRVREYLEQNYQEL